MKNVIVIGGGPAGMIAAGLAASDGSGSESVTKVWLIEQNQGLGAKLAITGKGRCNLTNDIPPRDMLERISSNKKFLYSAFLGFTPSDTIRFFEDLGVPLKTERGQRVFPVSDSAWDVVDAMKNFVKKRGVKIIKGRVKEILTKDGQVTGVETFEGEKIPADVVILATGGLSYPKTGSRGDGFRMAKALGHKITPLHPCLCPIRVKEDWVNELEGLSLRNIAIELRQDQKVIYKDFGEMLFREGALTGPVILSASRYVSGKEGQTLVLDLKPALDYGQLDARILRDFDEGKNQDFVNGIRGLLPKSLVPVIVSLSGVSPSQKLHSVTKEQRKRLVGLIKGLNFTVTGTAGYDEAVITRGGVDVTQVNPKTMESKLVSGLYFAGEILDVEGPTGGYNLQIAFSTGWLAASSIGKAGAGLERSE